MGRFVAVTLGAVLAAGLAGCAAPADALNTPTAQVTIDGSDAGSYPVLCGQIQRQWTIETLPRSPGFTAIFSTDGTITPGLVRLRDVGGFSGTFGQDIVGEAQASVENGTFLISGTASGAATEQTRRSFTIRADC